MNWKPTASIEQIQLRAKILREIRTFFYQKEVLEVETPNLGNYSVTDTNLDALQTMHSHPQASEEKTLYLQTSPEFSMKRLLAAGVGSIYQICKCFRDDEVGNYHNPEFTMLEWYRINYSLQDLINETAQLIELLCNTTAYHQVTYQKAFIDYLKIDPLTCSAAELSIMAKSCGFEIGWENDEATPQARRDILLQFLFSYKIEPNLGQAIPVFVTHFPSSQAALSVLCDEDPRTAKRFELYYKGIELANGYEELQDPSVQLNRMQCDNEHRRRNGKSEQAIDVNLINALKSGLPQCSGVAMGLDRLQMVMTGADHIKQVMSFSLDSA